jgi:hypothetical protein
MSPLIRLIALLSLPLLVLLGGRVATKQSIAAAQIATPTGGPPPQRILYPAGWNLLAVTQRGSGIPINVPLYTLAPGGTAYEAVSPTDTQPGVGYWAYFATDNRLLLVPVAFCEACASAFPSIPLPAGQWVMIGNPYTAPITITVSGADAVYVYDPATGAYQQTIQLQPGQGAFAYSAGGGVLTFR